MSAIGRIVGGLGIAWLGALSWITASADAAEIDAAAAAQDYASSAGPVGAMPEGMIVCEAEEFRVQSPGWQAQNWGANYYAATLANTFLSRKAFLGTPAQCDETAATILVRVPAPGRYLALVRYEAAYRFETQFRLQVEQNGRLVLDRLYGARENLKIWPFREGLKKEVAWSWGAVENVVWEGHDAVAELQAGPATVRLIAGRQPGDAARRNVDLVLLTSDLEQVKTRLAKEGYLPLDGLLTQAGDLFLRLHNRGPAPVKLTVPPGTEHSPYWVHQRSWKPVVVEAEPGGSSAWVEVGSLLDALNDGQWRLSAAPQESLDYTVELALKTGERMTPLRSFPSRSPALTLAYDANTRYTRRIRLQEEVLYELVEYLQRRPVHGKAPVRTIVYAETFDPQPDNPRYTAAREQFLKLIPITLREPGRSGPAAGPSGYVDLRGKALEPLEAALKDLQAKGLAQQIASVSLGDEIGLPAPPTDDHEAFRAWLRGQGLKPDDVAPGAGSWEQIRYTADPSAARSNPRLFSFAKRYQYAYGIQACRPATELIRRYLPHAGIGANFSPHHGHPYLGETHKWIDLFRQGGMTMPWSEDYVFQPPLGSQQMNFINLDLFRAGLRGQAGKIHYYVMPHWPGNTPDAWRRQFYGDLAHGMKIVDLFEFRPVQAAYTENHVNAPEMYQAVRQALFELGLFEDVVQDGQVRPGIAALWFSQVGDLWDDNAPPFGAAKRALYVAIRHQQLPLDFVTETDALSGRLGPYRLLYLADRHVSRAAAEAIAKWVESGGRLVATAGAGLWDEFHQPNEPMARLLGLAPGGLETPEGQKVAFLKQDLPFTPTMDTVAWFGGERAGRIPVLGARHRFRAAEATVQGTYLDGSPAVAVRDWGKGRVLYCGFLPGLSYFAPAIPRRPLDRNSRADSMIHLIPTEFDRGAYHLIGSLAEDLPRPVVCSEPLVESTVLESRQGVVIPLVNWSGKPVRGLTVTVDFQTPANKVELATGRPVKTWQEERRRVFQFDLDAADALLLR